jgi:hypothetical protein
MISKMIIRVIFLVLVPSGNSSIKREGSEYLLKDMFEKALGAILGQMALRQFVIDP